MQNDSSLEGRKAMIEETMDSGEFFLSSLRNRVSNLQSKRDALRATLNELTSEERTLKVRQNTLNGLKISQDLRHRQDMEAVKSEFHASEELLWASKMDKEEKLRKLEADVIALRKRKGLIDGSNI
jgi:hypothetical protein